MTRAPYYIYPALQALRTTPSPSEEEARKLRRLIAANIGDTAALKIILGEEPEEFAGFYPDLLPPDLTTADTIDSFLNHFGNPDLPTPQAAEMIPKAPADVRVEDQPTEKDFREAVKNRDYQLACEIIDRLSLINPEKSIYFADQMRFLRKLILIQNSAKN